MCLYIDTNLHSTNKHGVRNPIVTNRPLVVWKYLERRAIPHFNAEDTYYWASPYRGMRYEFGKLYTAEMQPSEDDNEVNAGLHAYRGVTKRHAQENAGLDDGDEPELTLFPALIPAKSKIFVSDDYDGEVVSNKLIVFSDMTALKAYTGVSRLACPVTPKSLTK